MADYPAPNTVALSGDPPVTATLIVYALLAVAAVSALISSGFPLVAPLMGVVGIIGIVIAYVKRGEAEGSWVASHLRWLIRTFWYSLLWGAIGVVFAITLIGLVVAVPIWAAASIWVIYRVAKGYLLFKDSRPIPGM